MNVIIVDDAPFIQEILQALLKEAGVNVIATASNGVEAVTLSKALKPDAIFMDLIMPEMSGIDATKAILENDPTIQIIAISTVDQEFMVMKAIEAGCVTFIAKPFQKQDLLKCIGRIRGQNAG